MRSIRTKEDELEMFNGGERIATTISVSLLALGLLAIVYFIYNM